MKKVVLAGKETEERLKPPQAVANRDPNVHMCGLHKTQFIRVSTRKAMPFVLVEAMHRGL